MTQEYELISIDTPPRTAQKIRDSFNKMCENAEQKAINKGSDSVRRFWNMKNLRKREIKQNA